MKIVFMGTPNFAVPILKKLIDNEYQILLVVTQPDKMVGRKKVITPSPVKLLALENNLEVFQPEVLKNDYQKIIDLKPDLIITAAYGQMLPKLLLDEVTSINVHGSLLPKYRGGAPIQYALFDGLEETGISIMYMKMKMDSGDIIKQAKIKIDESDNYESLSNKLSYLGSNLLIDVLNKYKLKEITSYPQDEKGITYAYNLTREDEIIDFNLTSKEIINKIRGLSPNIGGSFKIENTIVKVFLAKESDIINNHMPGTILEVDKRLLIKTKDSSLEILEIQEAGKKKMKIKDYLNGQKIFEINKIIKGVIK